MTDVNYNFLVEVMLDGAIRIHPSAPETIEEVTRAATPVEIVATALKLAHDLDQQILIERITDTLMNNLVPPVETVPDQVRDALKERGITPDAAVTEEVAAIPEEISPEEPAVIPEPEVPTEPEV